MIMDKSAPSNDDNGSVKSNGGIDSTKSADVNSVNRAMADDANHSGDVSPAPSPAAATETTKRSGSSRRKPKVTRKVVEETEEKEPDDEEDEDENKEEKNESSIFACIESMLDEDEAKAAEIREERIMEESLAAESLKAAENAQFVLPEGTVVVQPEEVQEKQPAPPPPPKVPTEPKTVKKPQKGVVGELDIVMCTACNKQINPNIAGAAKRHPILKVLICKKCYAWYTSDDIEQDEDGSDERCRWCGDGGNLICCDFCHNAFCKACIKRNLGRSELSKLMDAGEQEKWHCYVCECKPLAPVVAQCDGVLAAIQAKAELARQQAKREQQRTRSNGAVPRLPPAAVATRMPVPHRTPHMIAPRPTPRPAIRPTVRPTPPRPGVRITAPRAPVADGWNIEISELSCPHVLERTLAATQSMNMLLSSLRDDLKTSARIPQPQASAVRREIAAKLRRAMLAFRRSFDDIRIFARTVQEAAVMRAMNSGPKPVGSVVKHGHPPQKMVMVGGKMRTMASPLRASTPMSAASKSGGGSKSNKMEVIELSDSDDEQAASKKTNTEKHSSEAKRKDVVKDKDSTDNKTKDKASNSVGGNKRKHCDESGSGEENSNDASAKKNDFQLRIAFSSAKRAKASAQDEDAEDYEIVTRQETEEAVDGNISDSSSGHKNTDKGDDEKMENDKVVTDKEAVQTIDDSLTEGAKSSDQNLVTDDNDTVLEDDETSHDDKQGEEIDQTMTHYDKMPNDDKLVKETGQAVTEDDKLISDDDKLVEEVAQVMADDDKMSNDDKLVDEVAQAMTDDSKISSDDKLAEEVDQAMSDDNVAGYDDDKPMTEEEEDESGEDYGNDKEENEQAEHIALPAQVDGTHDGGDDDASDIDDVIASINFPPLCDFMSILKDDVADDEENVMDDEAGYYEIDEDNADNANDEVVDADDNANDGNDDVDDANDDVSDANDDVDDANDDDVDKDESLQASASKRSHADINAQRLLHRELLEDSSDGSGDEKQESSSENSSSDDSSSDNGGSSSGDLYKPLQKNVKATHIRSQRTVAEKLCKVCSDQAEKKNFGILTCNDCRHVFQRYLRKGMDKQCKKSKKCVITVKTRNQCRYCWLQKCLKVGMTDKEITKKTAKQRKDTKSKSGQDKRSASTKSDKLNGSKESSKKSSNEKRSSKKKLDNSDDNSGNEQQDKRERSTKSGRKEKVRRKSQRKVDDSSEDDDDDDDDDRKTSTDKKAAAKKSSKSRRKGGNVAKETEDDKTEEASVQKTNSTDSDMKTLANSNESHSETERADTTKIKTSRKKGKYAAVNTTDDKEEEGKEGIDMDEEVGSSAVEMSEKSKAAKKVTSSRKNSKSVDKSDLDDEVKEAVAAERSQEEDENSDASEVMEASEVNKKTNGKSTDNEDSDTKEEKISEDVKGHTLEHEESDLEHGMKSASDASEDSDEITKTKDTKIKKKTARLDVEDNVEKVSNSSDKEGKVMDSDESDKEIVSKKQEKVKTSKGSKRNDKSAEEPDSEELDEKPSKDSRRKGTSANVDSTAKRTAAKSKPSSRKTKGDKVAQKKDKKSHKELASDNESDSSFDSSLEDEIAKLSKMPTLPVKLKKNDTSQLVKQLPQVSVCLKKIDDLAETCARKGAKPVMKKNTKIVGLQKSKRVQKRDLVEELNSSAEENQSQDDEEEEEEEQVSAAGSNTKGTKSSEEEEEEDADERARKALLADDSDDDESDDDSSVEGDGKVKMNEKKKKKELEKQAEEEDDDASSDSSACVKTSKRKLKSTKLLRARVGSSDSDSSVGISKERGGKRKQESSSNSDSSSSKNKKSGRKGKDTKKRRRIKAMSSDSDNDKNTDEVDSAEDSPTKLKRKKIHKILKSKKLSEQTQVAAKEEEERRKRIKERQKRYNQVTETDNDSPTLCPKTTKLVLEMDEETNEPLIEVHSSLIKMLKPHQVEAVKFLWDCCLESLQRAEKEAGSGCILAHCMGLGKTLSVITFVHTVLSYGEKTNARTCMIVCPLNTVLNWQAEWDKWLEEDERFDVYELSSIKDNASRADALESWQETGGILIIGYNMFRNLSLHSHVRNKRQKRIFTECLVNPGPDLVVCDEGHVLKNDATAISKALSAVRSQRRIVLTGTPLQNNLIEYHCMVDFVKPKLLGSKKEFCNRFVNPITNGQCADSTATDVKIMKRRAHVLHETLAGCVQRRDYSALTKFLMPKHEYVVLVRLSPLQCQLYERYLQGKTNADGQKAGTKLFADYNNLMRIWTHPWVLRMAEIREENKKMNTDFVDDDEDSLIDDEEEEDSLIDSSSDKEKTDKDRDSSSDDSDNSKKKSNEVVSRWKTRSRGGKPGESTSKEQVPKEEEEEQPDEKLTSSAWWTEYVNSDDQYKLELSGKLMLLAEILKMCESIGDKILVFSQSLLSLDLIEHFLEHWDGDIEDKDQSVSGQQGWVLGADYFRMDGSTSAQQRHSSAGAFNNDENHRARLFLISTKAGSLGTNLVAANRVVMFDASWNPSHDVQSIFRVYRFGQLKPVYIYRLLAQGTMEEKIYERQVTKESLSQRVVDEHQIERHFNASDLQELYNFTPDRLDDPNRVDRPTPALPKDLLLAELLTSQKKWIVDYHQHDSLLENQLQEELTEDERKAAWEDYENDKKGRAPAVQAGFATSQQTAVNNGSLYNRVYANLQMQAPYIARSIYAANPTLTMPELQSRTEAYIHSQVTQQVMLLQMQRQKEQERLMARHRLQQIQQHHDAQQQQQQQHRDAQQGGLLQHMLSGAQPATANNSIIDLVQGDKS